jgi:hypothetical protein
LERRRSARRASQQKTDRQEESGQVAPIVAFRDIESIDPARPAQTAGRRTWSSIGATRPTTAFRANRLTIDLDVVEAGAGEAMIGPIGEIGRRPQDVIPWDAGRDAHESPISPGCSSFGLRLRVLSPIRGGGCHSAGAVAHRCRNGAVGLINRELAGEITP